MPSQEREKFFEIFFFDLSVADAPDEINKFLSYYNSVGWKTTSGAKIEDPYAVARNWRPKGEVGKYPPSLLGWLKKVYSCVGHILPDRPSFILDLDAATIKENKISLRFKSRQMAEMICAFVQDNQLDAGYTINWSVTKK